MYETIAHMEYGTLIERFLVLIYTHSVNAPCTYVDTYVRSNHSIVWLDFSYWLTIDHK